jgi:branched-chain amino acid:cation transporter, LIVCS family
LTLDALSALVFGGMVVAAIRDDGIRDRKKVAATTLKAGLIAVTCLAFVYFSLAYMGATSQQLGMMDNGGEILTAIAFELFGSYGSVLLGIVVLLACLTTSVGLSTSCAQFLNRVFPKLSYKKWLLIVAVFSAFVANVGLTQLIAFSVLAGIFGFDFSWLEVLPLYDQGIGWLVPAVIGSLLGYVIGKAFEKKAALT